MNGNPVIGERTDGRQRTGYHVQNHQLHAPVFCSFESSLSRDAAFSNEPDGWTSAPILRVSRPVLPRVTALGKDEPDRRRCQQVLGFCEALAPRNSRHGVMMTCSTFLARRTVHLFP